MPLSVPTTRNVYLPASQLRCGVNVNLRAEPSNTIHLGRDTKVFCPSASTISRPVESLAAQKAVYKRLREDFVLLLVRERIEHIDGCGVRRVNILHNRPAYQTAHNLGASLNSPIRERKLRRDALWGRFAGNARVRSHNSSPRYDPLASKLLRRSKLKSPRILSSNIDPLFYLRNRHLSLDAHHPLAAQPCTNTSEAHAPRRPPRPSNTGNRYIIWMWGAWSPSSVTSSDSGATVWIVRRLLALGGSLNSAEMLVLSRKHLGVTRLLANARVRALQPSPRTDPASELAYAE